MHEQSTTSIKKKTKRDTYKNALRIILEKFHKSGEIPFFVFLLRLEVELRPGSHAIGSGIRSVFGLDSRTGQRSDRVGIFKWDLKNAFSIFLFFGISFLLI